MKSKQDCSFWSSKKCRKWFSKINERVISHPNVIQSNISNGQTTVKFDDENGGENN